MERFQIEHFTSLFDNATEGFVVTDDLANIILVNPSACHTFGYTSDELIGKKIEILIPKQYKTGHVKLRDEFYEHPKNRVMGHNRDLKGEKKSGENFPVEVSLSTYVHDTKRYAIAFIIDITKRKEVEESVLRQQHELEKITDEMRNLNTELEAKVEERTIILREALQRLEQSQAELNESLDKERELNEIKSRFVSMASHEFRTPLSTVLSSASLLGKYTTTEDQPQRTRHVEKIKGSVKHLNDLLEDFLSLGKLDEGKVATHINEFNVCEVLQETIDEMQSLSKKDQKIIFRHKGKDVLTNDKKLVKNILINLISNAIKFSEPFTEIYIDCDIAYNSAVISIRDTGIGISDEDKEHLFTSFFRGKNATNIQGTGLGLHIVKRYLDLLSGSIELNSQLAKGTEIIITLPDINI